MNFDFLLWGITLRRGYLSHLLPSWLSKGCRDNLRSAESACQALRRIRKDYRLSQTETAALMGTSAATVQAWEAGRRKPLGSARVLILLVEQALGHWPPGKWRQIWGFPLTYIIAARKRETYREAENEFWAKFESFSPKEKKAVILNWEADLSRMRELTEGACLVKKVENAPSGGMERGAEATVPCLLPGSEDEVADKLREWKTVLEYEEIRQLAD